MKNKLLKLIPVITLSALVITTNTTLATNSQTTNNLSSQTTTVVNTPSNEKEQPLENNKNNIIANPSETTNEALSTENNLSSDNKTNTRNAIISNQGTSDNSKTTSTVKVNRINQNTSTTLNVDTDGDGILDKDEKTDEINKWNFSARDALMFSTLSYFDDSYIKGILNNDVPFISTGEDSNRLAMIHYELSPFWQVRQTYHYDNGFDAVIFENKNTNPNLKSNATVLAIRGTDETKDLDDDLALFVGANPGQGNSIENLLDSLSLDPRNSNMYITGHSLGGYLTLRAHAYAEQKNYSFVKKSYTFNAPKVKGNIFNKKLQQQAQIVDNITAQGKAVHFKVNNDQIIPFVGFVTEATSVGSTKGKHALSSFYEEQVNKLGYFSVGIRNDITGTNYSFNNMVIKGLNNSQQKNTSSVKKKRIPTKNRISYSQYRIAL